MPQTRRALRDTLQSLESRAHQFRVVQKRLLLRFRDRAPPPANQLDVILSETHGQLMALGRRAEELQAELRVRAAALSCAVSLMLLLMRLRFSLDDANADALAAHLSEEVAGDEQEQVRAHDAASPWSGSHDSAHSRRRPATHATLCDFLRVAC